MKLLHLGVGVLLVLAVSYGFVATGLVLHYKFQAIANSKHAVVVPIVKTTVPRQISNFEPFDSTTYFCSVQPDKSKLVCNSDDNSNEIDCPGMTHQPDLAKEILLQYVC